MKYALYLASDSFGRKNLLQQAQIPFQVISHHADETQCSLEQPIQVVVSQLAELKMAHVVLPEGVQGQIILVLTADTLTLNSSGKLLGKPTDRQHAIAMLQDRNAVLVATAFCLEKKEYNNGAWHTVEKIMDYDEAWCVIDVPEVWVDFYLSNIPFLQVSGSISIDGFGEQFVKEIKGNYSAIIGMPMFKLRQALYSVGFYDDEI